MLQLCHLRTPKSHSNRPKPAHFHRLRLQQKSPAPAPQHKGSPFPTTFWIFLLNCSNPSNQQRAMRAASTAESSTLVFCAWNMGWHPATLTIGVYQVPVPATLFLRLNMALYLWNMGRLSSSRSSRSCSVSVSSSGGAGSTDWCTDLSSLPPAW